MTIMQSFFTTAGKTLAAPSSISYTSAGTFTWTAPTNVYSVSVVAVGGGGAGTYKSGPCCPQIINGSGAGGAGGAVRIMWPGCIRSFPSTSAGSP